MADLVGWNCPICNGPLVVRQGADGATPIGRACVIHGVLSLTLPERTTMDMGRVPAEVRARLGFASDGSPLPVEELPEGHPRRNEQAVARARAADPGRPVG